MSAQEPLKVVIIAAVSDNAVIGKAGQLPWRLRADLRWFKSRTSGHVLVMGRKTWDSIGRPLPGRRTVVVSRSELELPDGVLQANSLGHALELAAQIHPRDGLGLGAPSVFLAGGESIYREGLLRAEELALTRVEAHIDEGDALFPAWNHDDWEQQGSGERVEADDDNDHAMTFECWRRRT